MKRFITSLLALSMAASMTVTAFADQPLTLGDGTTSETSVDQFYSIEQEGETEYQDTMMVKVAWETSVINSKYETKKTWNPKDRKWDTVKNQKGNAQGEAEFKLTNYSSTAVNAEIAFTAADNMASKIKSVEFTPENDSTTDNKTLVNIATPVSRDVEDDYVYADDAFTTETVNAVITLDTGVLNGNTNGAEKLGTYKITISKEETAKKRTGADVIAYMNATLDNGGIPNMNYLSEEVTQVEYYFESDQVYEQVGPLSLDMQEREYAIMDLYNNLSEADKELIQLTEEVSDGSTGEYSRDYATYSVIFKYTTYSYSPADGSGNSKCSYYQSSFIRME